MKAIKPLLYLLSVILLLIIVTSITYFIVWFFSVILNTNVNEVATSGVTMLMYIIMFFYWIYSSIYICELIDETF